MKIKVRTREEIRETLDANRTCKSVMFPISMNLYAGQEIYIKLVTDIHTEVGVYSYRDSMDWNFLPEWLCFKDEEHETEFLMELIEKRMFEKRHQYDS